MKAVGVILGLCMIGGLLAAGIIGGNALLDLAQAQWAQLDAASGAAVFFTALTALVGCLILAAALLRLASAHANRGRAELRAEVAVQLLATIGPDVLAGRRMPNLTPELDAALLVHAPHDLLEAWHVLQAAELDQRPAAFETLVSQARRAAGSDRFTFHRHSPLAEKVPQAL